MRDPIIVLFFVTQVVVHGHYKHEGKITIYVEIKTAGVSRDIHPLMFR